MKIKRTKTFLKAFEKCSKSIKTKIVDKLEIFLQDPGNPVLNVHELKGVLHGIKSFNVTGDYRVWFMQGKETGEIVLLLLNVGTHSQLYG